MNIHSISPVEVLGHICVDGRVLERSVCMDARYRACVLLSLSWWVVQKGDLYLSQGGVGEDGGPGSMADSAGRSTAPMAAAGEAPVVWWAVQEGTEAQLAHLQVASSTWAKAAVCRERALGTATAIVPWHAGAHFRDLPSLSMLLWSSCCPRICRDCSVNTSALCWTLGACNRQPVLCLKNKLGGAWLSVYTDVELREEQSLSRLRG